MKKTKLELYMSYSYFNISSYRARHRPVSLLINDNHKYCFTIVLIVLYEMSVLETDILFEV